MLRFLYSPTLTSIMTTGKTIALTRWIFLGKVMSLLFNMPSRLVITFLPRSKRHLISWLQSPSAVILEPPPKIKSLSVSIVSLSICHEVMGVDSMMLVFWTLSFKPAFLLCSFTFIKRLFSSSSFSALRVVSSAYLRLLKEKAYPESFPSCCNVLEIPFQFITPLLWFLTFVMPKIPLKP